MPKRYDKVGQIDVVRVSETGCLVYLALPGLALFSAIASIAFA